MVNVTGVTVTVVDTPVVRLSRAVKKPEFVSVVGVGSETATEIEPS